MQFSNFLSIEAQPTAFTLFLSTNEVIDQMILILDVDGVVRESVEAKADARVLSLIKILLDYPHIHVVFISGTPIDNDLSVEFWRRGNLPLREVFGSFFQQEILEEKVSIYGLLGGHCLNKKGNLEIVDEYSLETSFELSSLLLRSFLTEVLQNGTIFQKQVGQRLLNQLNELKLKDFNQSTHLTAKEFMPIVLVIREYLDPHFKLVNNGALVETHTSNPPWESSLAFSYLQDKIEQISQLHPSQKQIATGFAKRGEIGFNYLLVSKTNKGLATKTLIQDKLKQYSNALIITIGDTQVDFPMYQNAHLAFHVGSEKALSGYDLPNCMIIRDSKGADSQHVEGTLKVLDALKDCIGHPKDQLKLWLKQNSKEYDKK